MATTQIVDMVLDALVVHLQRTLIDEFYSDDPSRPAVVKKGLLTDNKNQKAIQLGVQGGDHENPDEMDGIVSLAKLPQISWDLPAREIGGSSRWMRRGVVRVESFQLHKGINEDDAFQISYELLGRVMREMELMPTDGLEDGFGEKVISPVLVYANTYFESGGPPASYIFRGKVFWAVFTERLQ